ncbi:MAG: molybdopterin molybdenumtransferase MoeA [Pseudonocardiaceae bacterium]|nr:molybdopterin molybdenumtransferase MoeA [Pseudonocardiaceae bacterium]
MRRRGWCASHPNSVLACYRRQDAHVPSEPLTVNQHRAAVADLVGAQPPVTYQLADCRGLVLAADVAAPVSLPPFDNAAMDGYAVRSVDIAEASAEHPVELPVAEDIPAGRTDVVPLLPGTAHRIMTGAPLPPGADTIVQVELTDAGEHRVRVLGSVPPGKHLRRTGEDVVAGATVLTDGTVLGPAQLGLAAAVGLPSLTVYRPPNVLVLSTGSELVGPGEPLRPGQIYESNSVMLATALREIGCRVEELRFVPDDVAAFHAALEPRISEVDLLVTSGGVSAGAYEVVKDALSGQGVEFTRVAVQPGGPQGCGRYRGVPVVTLPGNPVSSLISVELYLRPALLAAMGHRVVDRRKVRATLTSELDSPTGKEQYRRGVYRPRFGEVSGEVGPSGGPGSHLLASFAAANCLIVIDAETAHLPEGAEVDVLLFD